MYNKRTEITEGNRIKKLYTVDGDINNTIKSLINSNQNFNRVTTEEDADIGLKLYSGDYPFQEFSNIYPELKDYINRIIFYYDDITQYVDVMIPDKFIVFSTNNPNLELSDIIDSDEKERGTK